VKLFISICSVAFVLTAVLSGVAAGAELDSRITARAISDIKLINEIVKDPSLATVGNASLLLGPHSETELKFWMNSKTDGTIGNYAKSSQAESGLIRHSKDSNEYSVFLQHVRLTILAYSIRPETKAPHFDTSKIRWIIKKLPNSAGVALIGYTDLYVTNAMGKFVQLPVSFEFNVEDYSGVNKREQVSVYKIKIRGNEVFRWW
jgi:hypothetical protein